MNDIDGGAVAVAGMAERVRARTAAGGRFAALTASAEGEDTRLTAIVAEPGRLVREDVRIPATAAGYPALSPEVPAAAWYEREIFDLFGLVPEGAVDVDPLVLAVAGTDRPRPGRRSVAPPDGGPRVAPAAPARGRVAGEGVFTVPYGPVRSGVFESVEYVVETPGEDIPLLRVRPQYKHRGVEVRFEGATIDDGVLVAERAEGVASVAHATAFCQAVELVASVEVPRPAALLRAVHAELERMANHVDTVVRHTEAAGQAVAYARFSFHKERLLRLRADLCGSRFGRGVVVPGGTTPPLPVSWSGLLDTVVDLHRDLRDDLRLLMATPSFVDRLRGTGRLAPDVAERYGALGPVGRGSGAGEDVRNSRPYGAYAGLGHTVPDPRGDGDALARHRVRSDELEGSVHLIGQAVTSLAGTDVPGAADAWRTPVGHPTGEAVGWVEAPQGELLYLVQVEDGRVVRAKGRSASFHNFALFPVVFGGDIFTDFAFIEASFGLSVAGLAS